MLLDCDSSTIFISSSVSPYSSQYPCVYLPVSGLDLALEGGLVVGRAGLLELLMEGKHPIHQGDHLIVAGDIGGVGEIDG